MGRVITAPGILKNTQGQLDHLSELYQDIKDNDLKPVTITLDQMQNANGAYSHTTEDDRITEDMKAIAIEVGTPESFYDQISVTTGNGTCTVSCPDAHGSSTITVTFVHTRPIDGGEEVPESVTSDEFDILANRIGVLSNLETLDDTNLVGAVNELKGEIDDTNSKMQGRSIQGAFAITDTDTEYNVSDMSNASLLIFQAMKNATYRSSFVIPYSIFKNGRDCYFPFYAGNIVGSVYVKYVSDTKIKAFATDNSAINYLSIQGIG